ncbi:MAG: MerR family transcriptional regulator [Thermoanaerobaculia bacterium]
MAEKLYFKIGEACRQLDIQPYVLRYWETEFPALSPDKSKSGQRVYSRQDLGIIRRIKELLYDEGYTIAGAKKKLEGELEAGGVGERAAEEAAEKPKPKPVPKPAAKKAAKKAAKPAKKRVAAPSLPGRNVPARMRPRPLVSSQSAYTAPASSGTSPDAWR